MLRNSNDRMSKKYIIVDNVVMFKRVLSKIKEILEVFVITVQINFNWENSPSVSTNYKIAITTNSIQSRSSSSS